MRMVRSLGAQASEVRLPGQLVGLDGLIIPGGESTTMGLLMEAYGLMGPLRDFVAKHPVFGTCAGLIMLAKQTTDGEQPLLGVMDITVRRNAFGRQLRSFEASVKLSLGGSGASPGAKVGASTGVSTGVTETAATATEAAPPAGGTEGIMRGVFIRAPWVEEMGPGVEPVARYDDHVVGVKQGLMLGVAFHPELGEDTRLHQHFLEMIRKTEGSA